MLIVMTTTPTIEEGERLADGLVGAKLAACVQVLPKMTSVYFWEGEVQHESEHLLLIKTLPERYAAVERFITEHHGYDVPEITAVETANVSPEYMGWLEKYLG